MGDTDGQYIGSALSQQKDTDYRKSCHRQDRKKALCDKCFSKKWTYCVSDWRISVDVSDIQCSYQLVTALFLSELH